MNWDALAEKLKNNQFETETRDFRDEMRVFFDILVTTGAAFIALVMFSFVLRTTEYMISSQIRIVEAHAATIAATGSDYSASLMVRSGAKIIMAPGEKKTYSIGFKNIGTAVWKNNGTNFLSVYTMDPKYRQSQFYDSSWRTVSQPAAMKDPSVPTGTIGYFEFVLKAPNTAGTYSETFQIAAEDLTWVNGGKFTIEIIVGSQVVAVQPTPQVQVSTPQSSTSNTNTSNTSALTSSVNGEYKATLLLKSFKTEIPLGPSETSTITLGFKNNGSKAWTSESLRSSGTRIATGDISFRHVSWASADEVKQETKVVNPGELALISFTIQAPNSRGAYRPKFNLVVNGNTVEGSEVEIPVTVTSDGEISGTPISIPTVESIPEPELRVGLFKTQSQIMITATGDYDIYSGDSLIETILGGQPTKVLFDFDYKTYTVITPSGTKAFSQRIKFVPRDHLGVFTIPSYQHPTGWNPNLNDNRFRGKLEVYYVNDTGNLWVINELPIEYYLRGLAETTNSSPHEYQKALVSAARTYAFYHFTRNTKHGGHFHVDAEYDQVYRGYGNEIRTPNVTSAVEETRGQVVTYGGEVVITPYYSRSDGRTRAWEEVWGGGPKAWLRSVPTPYDVGQNLWGHGVGMSARDAAYRADETGAGWDQILKYYYTGIDLQKKWN